MSTEFDALTDASMRLAAMWHLLGRPKVRRQSLPIDSPSKMVPKSKMSTRHPDRDAELVALLREGQLSYQQIGEQFGISRERVHQLGERFGAIRDHKEQRRLARLNIGRVTEDEAWAILATAAVCSICDGPIDPKRGVLVKTCSKSCAEARRRWGYQLDPERRARVRRGNARSVLRHPDQARPGQLEWARRVLAGAAGNRRFVTPRTAQAIAAAGFETDVEPGQAARMPYRCAAVNLNGSPCSRGVPEEGEICHIHREDRRFSEPTKEAL